MWWNLRSLSPKGLLLKKKSTQKIVFHRLSYELLCNSLRSPGAELCSHTLSHLRINIVYIGMFKASFAGETSSKTVPQKFFTFLSPFYELFWQFFGHQTFKTTCLWLLVVVLEWVCILQEWGNWSGAKKTSL